MSSSYKKDCYDINESLKIHYSHGVREVNSSLNFLHYDTDLIIEYYRKGNASIHIEGNIYNIAEGDIVILNPDELHVTMYENDVYIEKIVLHIGDTILQQFGCEKNVFLDNISKKTKGQGNLILSENVKNLRIDERLEKCLNYAKTNTVESQILLTCKAIEILSQFSMLFEKNNTINNQVATSNANVKRIIDYINRHFTEEVTLDVLANRFHFSKYYISHLFKDYVGVSPYDYLIMRRLYNCNNLIRANHTVKEACFKVGFNNYSNFYRLYKKHFKITPLEFKEQLKTEQLNCLSYLH